MTLNDFIKRVDIEKDKDKMILYKDENGGWCNVWFEFQDGNIVIYDDDKEQLFTSD